MKIKNMQLEGDVRALEELMELKLRPKTAFRIKLRFEKIVAQFELYRKEKAALLEEAVKRNEDGTMQYVPGTQNVYIKEEFIDKVTELEEADGDEFTPISLTELDSSGVAISPLTLMRLGEMLIDDTP